MADARQQTIKAVYEDPRTGFGSIDLTWRLARARDRTITRQEVASYINGLRVQRDRPQRGYNSYVPPLPMHQLQIDLADMKAFGAVPYPYMFVAVDAFTKKVSAIPLKDKKASNTAQGLRKVISELGIPAHIYSDDGTEFKKEFREALEYWDINKLVTRGHAYFAERMIRTLKEAILRRIAAGVGRRGQWHLLLPDIISQINARKQSTTKVVPNEAYNDSTKAREARRNMEHAAKHKAPKRPEIRVGDYVRVRNKPVVQRGAYRVTESPWSERSYRVATVEQTDMGPCSHWKDGQEKFKSGICRR